jgi:hypothetical protein
MKRELERKMVGVLVGLHDSIRGDTSELRGDVSGISGDVDACEITPEERAEGVDVSSLVRDAT